MAEEIDFHPIRWVERFMRTDAEQPVGTARLALSVLRANQWVLFEWRRIKERSQFYVFKKKEVSPRLENLSAMVAKKSLAGPRRKAGGHRSPGYPEGSSALH
jgi:hypothetical protein